MLLLRFLKPVLPSLTWNFPGKEKILYLTFDDGPIPELTPWVLDLLRVYNAKATFFCLGKNIQQHPEIYSEILKHGHSTGNHTFHHLNGWKTNNQAYVDDIVKCSTLVHSRLFRPPYGKISPAQIKLLRRNYRIMMWDVLSKDYNQKLSGTDCFDRVRRGVKPGSVVVFHDSIKAGPRLKVALPLVLEHFRAEGYRFERIPDS